MIKEADLNIADGVKLAEDLASSPSLSPVAADGFELVELDVLSIALSIAQSDGMTLAGALAALTEPQPTVTDGLVLKDETRMRLPYLYEIHRKKDAHTLGKTSGRYGLGSVQGRYGLGG